MILNTFIYKGLQFDRQQDLEYKTLIYFNHSWVAKWDMGGDFDEFAELHYFINNICKPADKKYFVETKRIRVKGISGYGYLQPMLDIPSNFIENKRLEKIFERLKGKYPICDFTINHNVGYQDGKMKIYDLSLDE